MRLAARFLAALVALACALPSAWAAWPERAITLVVPYPAGGATDVIGRMVAKELATRLQANVVVDNRAGASGNIAARSVAKAKPDGYTLFLATTAQSINMAIYASPGYALAEDFDAVSMINTGPMLMLAHPATPFSTVAELIAYAARPGVELRYATAGNGTSSHMTAEVFSHLTGVKMLHVPYTGAAPALNGLLGAQVDIAFDALMTTLPYVNDGKLKTLGVTTTARSKSAPHVPSIAEQKIPALAGFNETLWNAVVAPRGTDPAILAKINAALADALRSDALTQRLREMGNEPTWTSVQDAGRFIAADVAEWKRRVKDIKVTVH